jgi:hypothetical protein
VDSYPWLGGDIDVDTWNNSVYGWVEHPCSEASQWFSSIKYKCSLLWYYLPMYELFPLYIYL